jgi:hypothetical protein
MRKIVSSELTNRHLRTKRSSTYQDNPLQTPASLVEAEFYRVLVTADIEVELVAKPCHDEVDRSRETAALSEGVGWISEASSTMSPPNPMGHFHAS